MSSPATSPLDGVVGSFTPPRVTPLYTCGLAAVTVAMLLLPAIYLVMIGMLGYALVWYARFAFSDSLNVVTTVFYASPLIAGAILADVGKLLEYEIGPDGKSRQSERGEALRHPFTGVALAMECGVPDSVCHIIAAHAAEGDLVKRTTEAFIVHHADFMAFLPFKNPKNVKAGLRS